MKTFAVFASGGGSNLQALIDACVRGEIDGRIGLVVSDKPSCGALDRARAAGLETYAFRPADHADRESYERIIVERCDRAGCEFIVLAGFMRVLTPWFIRRYEGRILNTHPARLPSFPGAHAVRDALAAGVAVTGCTIHFVDEGVDTGPIILQSDVPVLPGDSVETLTRRIQAEEHRLYPRVVNLFCRGELPV